MENTSHTFVLGHEFVALPKTLQIDSPKSKKQIFLLLRALFFGFPFDFFAVQSGGRENKRSEKNGDKRRRVEKTRKNIHTPSFLADLPSFVSLLGEF